MHCLRTSKGLSRLLLACLAYGTPATLRGFSGTQLLHACCPSLALKSSHDIALTPKYDDAGPLKYSPSLLVPAAALLSTFGAAYGSTWVSAALQMVPSQVCSLFYHSLATAVATRALMCNATLHCKVDN